MVYPCQLCEFQRLATELIQGAAVTVHHTQLPLSNLNSHLHCGFYFYCGYRFVIVAFDGGVVVVI
jgi:hypothetical protein